MAEHLALERLISTNRCTVGAIRNDDYALVARTLECPWLDNRAFDSCIPEGEYDVRPFVSHAHGRCFMFDDKQVFPRYAIEIHSGNIVSDTKGCILVGERFGTLKNQAAVRNSRSCLNRLLEQYPKGFKLTITERHMA